MSESRPLSLGPTVGRWHPRTYADVVMGAAAGLLDESHWVELKSEIPSGNPEFNAELARDLASLAPDGGVLIAGVKDKPREPGAVVGTVLHHLADRIDAVARSRIQPPLAVRSRELHDPDKPGRGCLVVEVPASPHAPHMAEGFYWGRSDRAKEKLRDTQIRDLLERGRRARVDLQAVLDDVAREDPIQSDDRKHGHLYVVAHPVTADDFALTSLLDAHDGAARTRAFADQATARIPTKKNSFEPKLSSATYWRGHPDGRLLTTRPHEGPRPVGRVYEPGLIDLVVRSDGGVVLTCGRGTDREASGWRPVHGEEETARVVTFPSIMLGLTHSVAVLAGLLAEEISRYTGSWQIGVLLDRMRDVVPHETVQSHGDHGYAFHRDVYRRDTVATTDELLHCPASVAERLIKPLLGALGVERIYLPYDPDEDPGRPAPADERQGGRQEP